MGIYLQRISNFWHDNGNYIHNISMINLNKGLHWKPEKCIGLKNSNQHYKHKLVVNQTPITTFTSLKGSNTNTNQTQDSKTNQTQGAKHIKLHIALGCKLYSR
jgi:hypothetical protein